MKKLMLIMVLVISILMVNVVVAVDYLPHKINTSLSFSFTDDVALGCNATTINYPNGSVGIVDQELTKDGDTYSLTLDSDYFQNLGTHCINLDCIDGYGDYCREVTNNGELPSKEKMSLSLVLLSLLVLFFIISLIGVFRLEDYKGRFALYWVAHVLIIAITFIAWQTSANYLSMDAGITGVFKIMFYFFTIGAFPMLLLSIAWMFYVHTMNEHITRLIDKGESPETAFKMAKKKKKGGIF